MTWLSEWELCGLKLLAKVRGELGVSCLGLKQDPLFSLTEKYGGRIYGYIEELT